VKIQGQESSGDSLTGSRAPCLPPSCVYIYTDEKYNLAGTSLIPNIISAEKTLWV